MLRLQQWLGNPAWDAADLDAVGSDAAGSNLLSVTVQRNVLEQGEWFGTFQDFKSRIPAPQAAVAGFGVRRRILSSAEPQTSATSKLTHVGSRCLKTFELQRLSQHTRCSCGPPNRPGFTQPELLLVDIRTDASVRPPRPSHLSKYNKRSRCS
ncbi:hypothetical protein FN846DRAFT_891638 [Sphaerosporella brunnea]|uniref:Uncharacterized protein n=1 Tax=Sphaerosporella brunnea TaxID=1250544 RepID=A0A5J5ERY5_9PEZI|nr:hypothetical protein FN846DRAFT_891638 [Sphaerosporella brunnea]